MKFAFFSTALLASSIAAAAPAVDGWYLSAFGGYTYLPSNIRTGNYGFFLSNVSYRDGYNVGGRIGFQSNPIRYEFEYTYISANPNRFRLNHITLPNVGGRLNQNLLMANLYYDFPEMLDSISPFLGVGIGYGFLETTLRSTGPVLSTFFKENGNSFAYQGTVGLTYNFSENYAINADYRYAATSNNNHFGRSFQAHMGNAGIIYRFDCVSYK
ncbi:MAG: OmpW family outer membrane protein [Legionella sp.]|uniref:outer membrane protein n=1 Tax=Legionella sp. TaxID=459 RepID=UPI0039E38C88